MDAEFTPVGIGQEGPDQLRIDWKDGHRSLYPVRALRLACQCAACIDEWTGAPTLREQDVASDVRPVRIAPVGRYGVRIAWTDGHDTGIYRFEYLRSLDAAWHPSDRGDP
jgi:DUF971 family protein